MTKPFKPRKLKNPLISIVMTIYNEAHVVEYAISTLLQQSYKKIELILVNNGSKDRTGDVIKRYKKDRRVRIVDLKKNAGPGGGRNAGAKIAKGEILIFIDADMVFDKNYIKGLTAPVIAGNAIGTFHDTELVKNKDRVWARAFSINRVENPGEVSGVFRSVLRDGFNLIGGFDTSRGYFDDNLGALGPSRRAHAICYHNNPEHLWEIFKHSRWVGRSLIQDPDNRKRFGTAVLVSLIGFVLLIAALFTQYASVASMVLTAGLALLLVFVLLKGIRRTIKDKYPEFLITVPIVWCIRLTGYWLGAATETLRRLARGQF